MKKTQFVRMLEIAEEKNMDNLEVGDFFLYGTSVIGQKQNKQIGDSITYYQVVDKKPKGIEYAPVFDYLERDKGEEE